VNGPRLRSSAAVMSMFLLSGCLSGSAVDLPGGAESGQPLGRIEVESSALGSMTLAPESCSSGDLQSFLGGDFSDSANATVVRLVVDPLDGPAVRVFKAAAPFEGDFVFRRTECAVFHFSLDSTGWRVNDVYDYRITLEVDCERPGEFVKGSLSTTHCH